MPAYDAVQPGGRGRRARWLMCAVPAAPAGLRCAGLGVRPGNEGAGKGRVGADVDYAQEDWLD